MQPLAGTGRPWEAPEHASMMRWVHTVHVSSIRDKKKGATAHLQFHGSRMPGGVAGNLCALGSLRIAVLHLGRGAPVKRRYPQAWTLRWSSASSLG